MTSYSICVCLTSLSIMVSRFIDIAANDSISCFYYACVVLWESIVRGIWHIFWSHLSSDEHLGCFHALGFVNSDAIIFGVHVSFWIAILIFSEYIPKSGIGRWYGSSFVFFPRNLRRVFHSGCTNLHSYQQCKGFLFLYTHSRIYYDFVVCFFFLRTILTSVRWYLIVDFSLYFSNN